MPWGHSHGSLPLLGPSRKVSKATPPSLSPLLKSTTCPQVVPGHGRRGAGRGDPAQAQTLGGCLGHRRAFSCQASVPSTVGITLKGL